MSGRRGEEKAAGHADAASQPSAEEGAPEPSARERAAEPEPAGDAVTEHPRTDHPLDFDPSAEAETELQPPGARTLDGIPARTMPSTPVAREHVLPEGVEFPQPAERKPGEDRMAELSPRFEVQYRLGSGGMSVVWAAHDLTLGRDVAVKVLPDALRSDPTMRRRFLREARAAAKLRHPGIVTVYDIDPVGGFIVMERIRGQSLRDSLKKEGKRSPAEVRAIGAALLDALAVAHAAGIVHRDVKPGNVLVDRAGNIKLADFGIASFGESDLTSPGTHLGTPAYMAPEQLRGREVDARADIYSAGTVLFEAATGWRLHGKERSVRDPLPVLLQTTGDRALATVIARALRELPEERYADASAFARALAEPGELESGAPATGQLATDGPETEMAVTGDVAATTLATGGLAAPTPTTGELRSETPATGDRTARDALMSLETATLPTLTPGRRRVVILGVLAAAVGLGAVAHFIVSSAGTPDVATGSATSDLPATAAPEVKPKLALLPFDDRTDNPSLDFARAGLPYLLGTELRRASDVSLVGYYTLLDHVPEKDASRDDWIEEAGKLGATMVVSGELNNTESDIHMVIFVDRLDGSRLARIERSMAVDAVPATVRTAAADVAAAALGRAVALKPSTPHEFDVERELQLGIELLHSHAVGSATTHIEAAAAAAPRSGEAQYYLALIRAWEGAEPADTVKVIDHALELDVSPAQRAFLEGWRLLVSYEYPAVLEHFEEVAKRFPEEREVLYGLFEAQYHIGLPAEAMATYTRLIHVAPRWRLGNNHVRDYYRAHGNEAEFAAATRRALGFGGSGGLLRLNALFAARDYAGAIALLSKDIDMRPAGELSSYNRYLVHAYALTDQVALALALEERRAEEERSRAANSLFALHTLMGADRKALRWRGLTENAIKKLPGKDARIRRWQMLLHIEVPIASEERLRAGLAALDEAPVKPPKTRAMRLLLAGALGDRKAVRAATRSPLYEMAEMARGFSLEAAGKYREAAAAWHRASEHSPDGFHMILERYFAARALRRAGAHEKLIHECEEVIAPRTFQWAWATTVVPCLVWTGEALAALGRPDEARAAYERVLRLRSAAGKDDPWVAAARAGL